eukprot:1160374-Pelagomonas_calceolata.AAC.10
MADVLSSVAGTIIPPGAEPSRNAYLAVAGTLILLGSRALTECLPGRRGMLHMHVHVRLRGHRVPSPHGMSTWQTRRAAFPCTRKWIPQGRGLHKAPAWQMRSAACARVKRHVQERLAWLVSLFCDLNQACMAYMAWFSV